MTLDFENMPLQDLPHFKGGEGIAQGKMYVDDMGKIALLILPVGATIGVHAHDDSAEIIRFLSGTGIMIDDGAELPITPGMCHYCPKGHSHGIINNGTEPLTMWAVIPNC